MALRTTFFQWQINALSAAQAATNVTVSEQGSSILGIKVDIDAIKRRIDGLQSTIELLDGELTQELQELILSIKETGVWVPKIWTGTTRVDGKETKFQAPENLKAESPFTLVTIDNLAYQVVSRKEFDANDDQCAYYADGFVNFRYAPSPSKYEDGSDAPTYLRFNYFVGMPEVIDPIETRR